MWAPTACLAPDMIHAIGQSVITWAPLKATGSLNLHVSHAPTDILRGVSLLRPYLISFGKKKDHRTRRLTKYFWLVPM
jgi:hypothetical protein